MKREDFSDEAWGKMLCDRWDALDELHKAGAIDEHPGKAGWDADSAVLRKAARDGLPGNVASSKQIMDEYAVDDPEHTPGAANPPARPGAGTAKDAALEELAIRRRSGPNMNAELHLARIKRGGSTSASVRTNASMIPGYDRLK